MPSSIDIPMSSVAEYDVDAPMAFRHERYWFLSFVMTPFKDIDGRAAEEAEPRRPRRRRR